MYKYFVGAILGVVAGAFFTSFWPLGLLLLCVLLAACALLTSPEHTTYRRY